MRDRQTESRSGDGTAGRVTEEALHSLAAMSLVELDEG